MAKGIGAKAREIYFTGCGTEADNWAIKGAAYLMAKKGKKHIISSKFEHHAVLHTLNVLEKEGFDMENDYPLTIAEAKEKFLELLNKN